MCIMFNIMPWKHLCGPLHLWWGRGRDCGEGVGFGLLVMEWNGFDEYSSTIFAGFVCILLLIQCSFEILNRNSASELIKQKLVFAGSEEGKLLALRQSFAEVCCWHACGGKLIHLAIFMSLKLSIEYVLKIANKSK